MRSRKSLEKLRTLAVNLLLRPIALAAPRSASRWAFGHAGGVFAGNPRFLFLWMAEHRPEISVTWITSCDDTLRLLRESGYACEKRWSRRGVAAALRAGAFLFAHDPGDVNLALCPGALQLNLWHGVGLKALHQGHKPASGLYAWLRAFLYAPYDIVAATSEMTQAHFAAQFRLPPERCPILGYPRLDVARDTALRRRSAAIDRAAGFDFDAEPARHRYIYMPTFRDSGRPFFDRALPDLARLDAILRARDAILYVKPHPRTPPPDIMGLPGIRLWPEAIEVGTYLDRFAGLITDYSSVLYDYLHDREDGAIVYAFDRADYARERTLLYAFEDNIAGALVEDFDGLCRAIGEPRPATAGDRRRIAAIRQKFWGGSPSPASAAVVDHVRDRLAGAGASAVRGDGALAREAAHAAG